MVRKALLFIAVFSVSVFAQIYGPKIYVPSTKIDFGDIPQGKIVKSQFVITNNGGDLLKIERVISSCGCTVVEPEKKELKPGESTTAAVEFNSTGRVGKQQKHVTIISNDKEKPQLLLEVVGNVLQKQKDENLPRLKFEKNQFDFGKVKDGDLLQHTFNYKNTGKSELIIKDVRSSCGCTVPFVSKKNLKPGEEANLKVEFDTSGRSGRNSKSITIFSNDPDNPVFVLTIYADIEKKIGK
jgi:uncharacterized cupredoxin-like copper-binding protein